MLSLVVKTKTIVEFIKIFISHIPLPIIGPAIGKHVIGGLVADGSLIGMTKALFDGAVGFFSLFIPI